MNINNLLKLILSVFIVITVSSASMVEAALADNIYWTNAFSPHKIQKRSADGTGAVTDVFTGSTFYAGSETGLIQRDIVTDADAGGLIYWVNDSLQDNYSVMRDLQSGGSPNTLYNDGTGYDTIRVPTPYGIVSDDNFLYWTDRESPGRIYRGAKASTTMVELYIAGSAPWSTGLPFEIAIDENNLYWVTKDSVLQGDKDGSSLTELWDSFDIPNPSPQLRGIAVDVDDDYIYLTDTANDVIYRGLKDGSGTLDELFEGSTGDQPFALEVDDQYLYWTIIGSAKEIYRGNKDGTGTPDLLFTGSGFMFGLAIDFPIPEPTTYLMLGTFLLLVGMKRKKIA